MIPVVLVAILSCCYGANEFNWTSAAVSGNGFAPSQSVTVILGNNVVPFWVQNNASKLVDVYCETRMIFSKVQPGEITPLDYTCFPGGPSVKDLFFYESGTNNQLYKIGFGPEYSVFVKVVLLEDEQQQYSASTYILWAHYYCEFAAKYVSSSVPNNREKIQCVIPYLPDISAGSVITLTNVYQILPNDNITMGTIGPTELPQFELQPYWITAATKSGSPQISQGTDIYVSGEFSTNSTYKCILIEQLANTVQIETEYASPQSMQSVPCKIANLTGIAPNNWFWLRKVLKNDNGKEREVIFANPSDWPSFYFGAETPSTSTAASSESHKSHTFSSLFLILVIAIPSGVFALTAFVIFVALACKTGPTLL
jgi:hypothetical protein